MKNKSKQLPTDIDTLQALLLEKDNEIGKLQSKLDSLIEQLRLARHQRFGTSSEKQNPQQGELFDEAESLVEEEDALQTDVVTIPGYERKKAGRKPLPAHLHGAH